MDKVPRQEMISDMRIAIISDLFYPHLGGGELYLINIERQLLKHGHDVIHFTGKLAGTKSDEIFDGIKIVRTPIPFSSDFMRGRFFFPFMNFRLKELKNSDIIQSVTYPASVTGWIVGRMLGKPNVLFCHEFFRQYWKFMRTGSLTKRLYPLVENYIAHSPYDWAICPSEYSKKSLVNAGFNQEKITVAYHGIEERFKPDLDASDWRTKYELGDKKVFGFLGRLQDFGQKGIKYLLEATKIVIKEIPKTRLVLAGSGYEYIEPLVKNLGIEKFVVSLGEIPIGTEPKFYSMLDLFVGASISEGFGLSYAEASRCGRAVVATNASSIPEIIIDNKTGILVPVRNSKALAEAMITLLGDERLSRILGRNGAEYTKRFTWEDSVKKHIEVYERLRDSNARNG